MNENKMFRCYMNMLKCYAMKNFGKQDISYCLKVIYISREWYIFFNCYQVSVKVWLILVFDENFMCLE